MTKNNRHTVRSDKLSAHFRKLGDEFVIIENPNYVHPEFEICPIAPKITEKRKHLMGIVQDMDGTTTTTENLCLYSLETMVRKFTGRLSRDQWAGLDREQDYPHIIGNSTTKHVEYLVKTYGKFIDRHSFQKSFLHSAWLTLAGGRDQTRKQEVRADLKHFKCNDILAESNIAWWRKQINQKQKLFVPQKIETLINKHSGSILLDSFSDQVRAAIDIYYQIYHEILFKIETNASEDLHDILSDTSKHLIEPMPGVGIFLATVKGWLGEDVALFYDELWQSVTEQTTAHKIEAETGKEQLAKLGRLFQEQPLKTAIVTSSIAYEAHIVLTEVFRVIRAEIEQWPLSIDRKKYFIQLFSDYHQVFDRVITASDSSEIRLKPHRDLYSLALHQLGIHKQDFDKVIGFEDSESGTIAIRAAGIGFCVAVPFADTQGHQLEYASYILRAGLPEAMVVHQLFLISDS